MPWQAISIVLSDDDRQLLESWCRAGSAEYRNVLRSKIVLGAADGKTTVSIAKELGIAGQTVSKWRGRFAAAGVAGLSDQARSGKPVKYGDAMERRILAKLDEPPPRQVRQAIDKFIAAYSEHAAPFEWTKEIVHSIQPKSSYADLGK